MSRSFLNFVDWLFSHNVVTLEEINKQADKPAQSVIMTLLRTRFKNVGEGKYVAKAVIDKLQHAAEYAYVLEIAVFNLAMLPAWRRWFSKYRRQFRLANKTLAWLKRTLIDTPELLADLDDKTKAGVARFYRVYFPDW